MSKMRQKSSKRGTAGGVGTRLAITGRGGASMRRARTVFVLLTLATRAVADTHVPLGAGERVHVVDVGQGEVVVLVPGLLGSAFAYRKLTSRLVAAGHRVVVVEPLGFGGSSRPAAADYSLTAQADRLALVLDTLGLEPAVVVGHAVGASMALRLAVRHPERVRAVVSLDGGPAESAATPGLRRAMRFAFLARWFGGRDRIRRTVRATLRERSADAAWVTEEVVEGYMAGAGRDAGETVQALRYMAKAREREPLVPRLGQVLCPVWLVIGDAAHARGVSDADMVRLREGLAALRVETVPNAGHFVFEEDPDAVAGTVDRALASTRARVSSLRRR
jgi:pimeloyl-ACP methyl ester carboxylesterase